MPFVVNKDQELDLEGLKANIAGFEGAGFDGYVAFGCRANSMPPALMSGRELSIPP